jgi:hypothetical protein
VSVVVVNYRTPQLTAEAVRSAMSEAGVVEVLVVDNASGDDAGADELRRELDQSSARIIDAGANLGFGRAVNLAVPEASGELILVLNSDARLLPGAVSALSRALIDNDGVGIAAPAVYDADGAHHQSGAYGRFPRPVSLPHWLHRQATDDLQPDWISGVAMMVRRQDFLDVGGFDDDFKMYLEDIDLCRRFRDRGKRVRRAPEAGVVHLGGRSWTSTVDKREQYHQSKMTYFRKRGAGATTIALLHVLRQARVAAARAVASRPRST